MIFGKTKLELKVGAFVFIGLGILMAFVLLIGSFRTWSSGYHVKFTFNFVNGVKMGAPVRFCGVDAGEVQEIKLKFNPQEGRVKVHIYCWLKQEALVPLDSTVWVNTLGLLGEKYIEIIPGADYTKSLSEGKELIGRDPIPMHEITEFAKRIAGGLEEIIGKVKSGEGTIGKLIFDDSLYKDVEGALKNKDGTVGKLFYDDSLYKELEALVGDIRRNPWKLFFKTKEVPLPGQETKVKANFNK
ncbi:MAG: MlaD family protein [Candidatus Omnitrophota bacterium]